MSYRLLTSVVVGCLLFGVAVSARAQGASTAAITGVVVDSGGAVIPGATVTVKNNGTAETFNTVSTERCVFSVPSLVTGTYTVTVTLEGFKTFVLDKVVVNAGVPASLRAVLEVGGISETITVQSNSEL